MKLHGIKATILAVDCLTGKIINILTELREEKTIPDARSFRYD